MGGLEEIIRQIHKDSEAEISAMLIEAEKECEKISQEGKKETEGLAKMREIQFMAESDLALNKMKSAAETKKKQDVLRIKQKVIENILEKAQEKIESFSAEKYFDLLLQIVENNAHKEKGIIYLNEKDLGRMPSYFVDELKEKGIALEVSEKIVDIKNGMILGYEDVQENCTFQALIDTKREILTDKVNRYIFG